MIPLKTYILRALPPLALAGTLALCPGDALRAAPVIKAPSAPAAPLNQVTAQIESERLNRLASDKSLQHSTTHAMQALMKLASGNVPSAISSGMNAYGKYRNSENLDHLGDLNTIYAGNMSSVGAASPTAAKKTDTSFRRLNPSFLNEGEFSKISAEFERKSGMKREDFLRHMSEISEKKISRNDPQLVDKLLSRYESFLAHIPNKEFRGKLEKGVKMVPNTVRKGLVAKAVAKFAGFFGSTPNPATVSLATPADQPEAGGAQAAATPAAADAPNSDISSESAQAEGAPASEEEAMARMLAGSGHEEPAAVPLPLPEQAKENGRLRDMILDAMDTQDSQQGAGEPTIFEIVKRKYRQLSPVLQKNP